MAVRNALLGGTDFTAGGNTTLAVDLNDTFDEIDRVVNLGN